MALLVIGLICVVVFATGSADMRVPGPHASLAESTQPLVAVPVAQAEEVAHSPELQNDPVRQYREQTRLSPFSNVLTAHSVELLEPNSRYDSLHAIFRDGEMFTSSSARVLFTSDHYYYFGDEVVTARLTIKDLNEGFRFKITESYMSVVTSEGIVSDEIEPLSFRRARGQEQYEAEVLIGDIFPDHHGLVQLSVEFEYAPGELHTETLRVFVTPADWIPAEFAGGYSDQVTNGSLVIEVGVRVVEEGATVLMPIFLARRGSRSLTQCLSSTLSLGARSFRSNFLVFCCATTESQARTRFETCVAN